LTPPAWGYETYSSAGLVKLAWPQILRSFQGRRRCLLLRTQSRCATKALQELLSTSTIDSGIAVSDTSLHHICCHVLVVAAALWNDPEPEIR
jgi:hypothetical protein